jgi:signal transduction histidine kinase
MEQRAVAGSTTGEPGAQPAAETPRFRFGRLALLLDFGFWTVFAILISLNRLLAPRGPRGPATTGWGDAAYFFFASYLWAVATPLIFWLVWRTGRLRRSLAVRVLLLVAAAVLLPTFLELLRDVAGPILNIPRFGPPRPGASLHRSWAILVSPWFLADLTTFTGIVAAGFAWDYFLRYRLREAEAARLQAQLVAARLAVLRTQLDPHFLFNTLNAVSALVARDPRGVRRMIARLSELLRYTLDGAQEQEIPLREELALVRRYLEILEIRYQGRLATEVSAEPEIEEARVPNLILQPLAENAVTHGVARAGGHGRIEVRARRDGDRLVVAVHDTGPGKGAEAGGARPETIGQGMGLGNTRARLRELYGTAFHLELRPDGEGGTVVEISLPYHTAPAVEGPERAPARIGGGDG